MNENEQELVSLSIAAVLFSYIDEKTYLSIACEEVWHDIALTAEIALGSACLDLALPLDPDAHAATQKLLFVSGMPFSAIPVESFYKPWSADSGGGFGITKSLYKGDCARHLDTLYKDLGLILPEKFEAMPDHLSLIIELFILLKEEGNEEAAFQIASDHLDWLELYDEVLKQKAKDISEVEVFSDSKVAQLTEGLRFYRCLLLLVTTLVRRGDCRAEISFNG